MLNEFTISIDIAKKSDYTGIQIYKKIPTIIKGSQLLDQKDMQVSSFGIIYMDMFQGLKYEDICDRILKIATLDQFLGRTDIILDGTGVGEAVVDGLRERKLKPYPIVFTNGNKVNEVYDKNSLVFGSGKGGFGSMNVLKQLNVPKKDMVDAAVLLLQQNRVKMGKFLKFKEEFLKQLSGFKGKINDKNNKRFEAETENLHDDLVSCFLMFAWWQHYQEPREKEEIHDDFFEEKFETDFKLFS